jgi:predicted SAM-dependent methyltransferase
MSMRRLHVGGRVRAPGWEVIDANPGPHVDHVGNAKDLSRFEAATFTDIYASHVLEHFDFKDEIFMTLVEWCRVLVPGGTLHISVPDMDILARLFLDRERLSKADRFMVMRMIFGGHVDQYDYHVVGLNDEFLADLLGKTGFTDMRRVADLGFFEDTSKYIFAGTPISLNMTAVKAKP